MAVDAVLIAHGEILQRFESIGRVGQYGDTRIAATGQGRGGEEVAQVDIERGIEVHGARLLLRRFVAVVRAGGEAYQE